MKAVVYDKFGLTGVLEVREIEKPLPRDNEVLIKVHAASINSSDWDLLRGKPLVLGHSHEFQRLLYARFVDARIQFRINL
jgi:NADPH:quinone reductase-like Zn-dependent oxidoreductase